MRKRITNEEFMESLKNVFGNEYDLSEVDYIDSRTKVVVICRKHGKFSALPHNLLVHKGCPVCRYEKSSSKNRCKIEDVIERCNEIHNFKYDYSLVTEYKNNRIKYPIICHEKDVNGKEHGVFYQSFDNHLNRGNGCPKCSGNAKRTIESVIEDANKVHNNKYDYSKSVYHGIHEKMCIICHEKDENGVEHGEFWQAPNDHLHGQGCPKCKGKKVWDKRGRLTVDDVKTQFEKVHGDKYDYSLFTKYKNNRTKIPVICKEHGVFYVTPNNHLMNRGCPKCKQQKVSEKQRLPLDEVKKRIKEAHGDKFLMPKDFEYKNNQDKIKLICKEHGEFWQNPFNLWKGVGCPKCNKSKLENEISLFLINNNIKFEEQKKFEWLGNYELDFYLPEYNIAIECQGIQHFKPIHLFGGEEQFKLQVKWDEEKKKLCEDNGVKIIYFSNKKVKILLNNDFPYKVFLEKKELLELIKETIETK